MVDHLMICIGKNSLPVLGCSVGAGGLLDAETLEETVIVLVAAGVLITDVSLLGIAVMMEYNIIMCS